MNLAELSKQIGMDLAAQADDLEPVEGSYDFKMFTRDHSGNGTVVKAYEEAVEGQDEPDFIIAGIASSTIKDLHGDTMLPSAIIDMEKAAQDNLTLYLNHKYTVPEDIAGSCVGAKITSSAVDKDGSPIYDLEFKTRVDKTNSRAVQTFKSLKGGTKLGMSIGANIPEGGAIRNKKTGALLISHVDLLETSIVAIPANPRSWIDSINRAIKSGVRADRNEHLLAEALAPVRIVATLETTGPSEPIVSDDTEPVTGEPVIESTDPSQEAPPSAPENDGSAPDAIATATDVLERTADPAVTGGPTQALLEAHNALATVTNSLIDESRARVDLERKVGELTQERDQAIRRASDVVTEVAVLLEQLGKLPVGQKASFRRIQEDFAGLENVYPEEFVRQLRSIGK